MFNRLDEKMRQPALIFRPELMRAVNTAHAKHRDAKIVSVGIIEHVLIRGAFRTAIRAAKLQRPLLTDALLGQLGVDGSISIVVSHQLEFGERAVDFVCGGKQQRRRGG